MVITLAVVTIAGGLVALVVLLGNHTPSRLSPPSSSAAAILPTRSTPTQAILAKRRGRTKPQRAHDDLQLRRRREPGVGCRVDEGRQRAERSRPAQSRQWRRALCGVVLGSPGDRSGGRALQLQHPLALEHPADSSTLETNPITDSTAGFTTEADEQFSATQSTNQGTQQVYGFYTVALDPNNYEVFALYFAASVSEYNKNSKAAITMLVSATG